MWSFPKLPAQKYFTLLFLLLRDIIRAALFNLKKEKDFVLKEATRLFQ